jgi:CRP/FNR family cyclic AMP-dependent transcriptional regulator
MAAEKATDLRRTKMFATWPEHALRELHPVLKQRRFDIGQTIIAQEEVLKGLYAVTSGQIEIYELQPDGRRHIRRLAKAGEVFGFLSVLDGKGSHHAYIAHRRTEVVFVPGNALFSVLRKHPDLWFTVAREMADFQRQMLNSIKEFVFESTRSRLVRTLRSMATAHGERDLQSRGLRLRITQDEIAALLGVSRQTVSKELKSLKAEGVLSIRYGHLILSDLHAAASTRT